MMLTLRPSISSGLSDSIGGGGGAIAFIARCSSCAVAVWPITLACSSAVTLCWFLASGSAPARRSAHTMFRLPFSAASISAVPPTLLCKSTEAPRASRNFTRAAWPMPTTV